MKRIKKLFVAVCLACAFCISFALSSCGYQKVGEFYSLQVAYDNGYITTDDLKNMSCIQGYEYKGFTPYDVGELDEEIALTIKQDYVYNKDGYTLDDVMLNKYFGMYNGCVAVDIELPGGIEPAVVNMETTIGGVTFRYSGVLTLKIWRKIS